MIKVCCEYSFSEVYLCTQSVSYVMITHSVRYVMSTHSMRYVMSSYSVRYVVSTHTESSESNAMTKELSGLFQVCGEAAWLFVL